LQTGDIKMSLLENFVGFNKNEIYYNTAIRDIQNWIDCLNDEKLMMENPNRFSLKERTAKTKIAVKEVCLEVINDGYNPHKTHISAQEKCKEILRILEL
jgi:hypothetical protein